VIFEDFKQAEDVPSLNEDAEIDELLNLANDPF
jgi:hypothetical protein